MTTFNLNQTYSVRSTCDYDCIFNYTVIKRTAKTITIKDNCGDVKNCRINKSATEHFGCEAIYPEGRYSMAPILQATNKDLTA